MKRILFALVPFIAAAGPEANEKLLQAVRDNRVAAVKPLLESGADVNARDAREATPLMYAAGVGSGEMLATLIDAGADVNLVNNNGSTALLWAVRDPGKVRLLLDKGAQVNVRRSDGVTPLLAALTTAGNVEIVRALLSKGADTKAVDRNGRGALLLAYRSRDAQAIRVLADAGVELKKKEDIGDTPFTRLGPGAPIEHIKALLDLGADPNELGRTVTLTLPVIGMFANTGRIDAVRLLLERGANPNLQGNKGYTALMLAVAAVRRNPEMIRVLLKGGAEVNVADEKGLTALDWALKQGETDLAAMLRDAGGKAMAPPARPVPVKEPRTIVAALDKVMPLLAQAGPTSSRKVACINCHNNSLPALALSVARQRGFAVPDEAAGHYVSTHSKTSGRVWEAAFWNEIPATYVDWALAEVDDKRGAQTDSVVLRALRAQREDGRWGNDGDSIRPPLSASAIKSTAFNIRVLDKWASIVTRDQAQKAIAGARTYLKSAAARDTQDTVFQLLGLRWSGAPASDIEPVAGRLLALQREDGGWGQMPTMPTDAYATGQALYALYVGARTPATDKPYQRGVQFLLRNQLRDGSWFVPTRAFGFQPYYEGGFPHGVDQFMSASGSSWAAMALTFAAPPVKSSTSVRAAASK